MSNNNNYTNVSNTSLSASAIISSMTGDSIKAILFDMATAQDGILILTNEPTTVPLTVARMVQAAISSTIIRRTGEGAITLSLGPDTAEVASRYVRLFNLDSTDKKVLLTFRADGSEPITDNVILANSSGTTNNVLVRLAGNAPAGSRNLFALGTAAGSVRVVEVYATNLTAGSEVVNFNILAP
jgi:hypothetical protein